MTETKYYALFDIPTPQNFEANQRGRLTPGQQTALEQAAKKQRSQVAIWVLTFSILFVLFGLLFWAIARDSGTSLLQYVILSGGAIAVGLGIFAFFLFPDISLLLAGEDLQNGGVEAALGKVAWTGRRYRLSSDSRELKTLRSGVTVPPPGEYRFYCLSHSGLVIMAEALGSDFARPSKDLLLDALVRANHFSMADLDVNRQGSLSGLQVLKLMAYAGWQAIMFLASALAGYLVLRDLPSGEDQLWAGLSGALVVILALIAAWNILGAVWDILTGKATHTEGIVTRHEHRTRNSRSYSYQINQHKFKVSHIAYNALIDGREYRVYFAPRSKRLLGIEPF